MKKNIKNSKIALTIPTGRPNVKKVVKSFLENARDHGYDLENFSIYLSVDLEYQQTSKEDFVLDEWTTETVGKVTYIFEENRKQIFEELVNKFNLDKDLIRTLFVGRGYSKQRNSALLMALRDKNDFAICIDDDEAPFIPVKDDRGNISWENLDFFTPHLKAMAEGADVTRGPYMGYISPIPSDFERDIPEEIRKKLGEALQLGSEVIVKHSFMNLMNQIKYLDKEELTNPSRPFTVKNEKNGKPILTGNMGMNLHSLKKGKIPIFFTPPKARGEDAIFALQLKESTVVEVDSYIFHDPFNMYPKIFDKKFPKRLKNIPVTTQTKDRFISALSGWLKYAPILILMTSDDEKEKSRRMNEMLSKIGSPTQDLAEVLGRPEILDCKNVLSQYVGEVTSHFEQLTSAQKMWKEELLGLQLNQLTLH